MYKLLQLIRFKNLLMIALTQLLFYFYWIFPANVHENSVEDFFYIIIATVLIAAGGNIINDVYDVKADRINKPKHVFISTFISKKKALILYSIVTILGIVLGSFVGIQIHKPWISLVFIGIAALLFWYSSHLKGVPIVGNMIVSLLVAGSILILTLFYQEHISTKAILVYSCFAFWINWMREMVKDIEDINGDYNSGISTLPIILGRNRVGKIVAVFAVILIAFIMYCIGIFLVGKTISTVYVLLTLILPLLFFILKIWHADSKREYRFLSLFLKLIMLAGILSILVIYYFEPFDFT